MSQQTAMLPSSTAVSSQLNRIPIATYRIQLRPNFSFDQLRGLIPYFKSLGISDLYLSPLFRAREGSTHGYDVVDHGQIEPDFGGEEAFMRMAEEARAAGLGILLDVVPNHMGVNDSGNRHWLDVLENGEGARYADFFDIDWDAIPLNLKHRVLQPVLGKPFGATLEDGELKVVYDDHRLQVAYYDRRFPLAPRTWPRVLELMLQHLTVEGDAREVRQVRVERTELESIIEQLEHVPKCAQSGPEAIRSRYREQRIARRRLGHLVDKRPRVRAALNRALAEINGAPGDPRSFDRLEELLNAQCYRLAYWRVASDEINYRRFFDINELAAIRVEDPRVFRTVHRLVGDLLGRNVVTGLRIDHPDGLLDPAQYFNNLQSLFRRSRADEEQDGASQVYVVAEKILSGEEQLATDWSIQGTTGYEFLNMVSRLLVNADGVRQIRNDYEELAGVEESAWEIFYESKKEAASVAMLSEMQMLAAMLYRIAQQQRASQDFTQPALLKSLQEVVACLQVYRTYVPPRGWEASEEDHRRIGLAVRWAKRRNPSMPRSLFDFIASVLLLQFPTSLDQGQREAWRHFALKLQQVSGPIAAKGVEDTAFYRYYPLASLNEVGGELDAGGLEPDEFHRLMMHRAANWPHSLSASSTHDTKRSEDLRARLHVLSELPDEWKDQVLLWRQMNKRWLHELYGEAAPDANEEYLLYQSLVGTWPLHAMDEGELEVYTQRLVAYMEKALRETKLHTSWINPSEDYEAAVFDFVHKILGPEAIAFQADLTQFAARIADAGFVNALSQLVLKLALPGVPDFYQGTELWDFSLVDPDNRRPVDYAGRKAALNAIDSGGEQEDEQLARDIVANWPDPQIKFLVTMRGLALRHRWHEVFTAGEYLPLTAEGEAGEHVFAFARMLDDRVVVAVIPRHFHRLTHRDPATATATTNSPHADWGDTTLVLPDNAPTTWRCEFSGHTLQAAEKNDTLSLRAADLFEVLPVALLTASKD